MTLEKIHLIGILEEDQLEVDGNELEKRIEDKEEISSMDDIDQQESSIVSLVAMHGITQYETMRLRSMIKGRTMVALIDFGGICIFTDSKLVSLVGLKVKQLSNFQVYWPMTL